MHTVLVHSFTSHSMIIQLDLLYDSPFLFCLFTLLLAATLFWWKHFFMPPKGCTNHTNLLFHSIIGLYMHTQLPYLGFMFMPGGQTMDNMVQGSWQFSSQEYMTCSDYAKRLAWSLLNCLLSLLPLMRMSCCSTCSIIQRLNAWTFPIGLWWLSHCSTAKRSS